MSDVIPEGRADLLTREKRAFADLALVLQDGAPQVTPVWFHYEDGLFIINTARGRVKDKVLRHHPMVAMSIRDPDNPYRYLLIRGRVVEETEIGGYDGICDLNDKYHGNRDYPRVPGQVRVTYKIKPERAFAGN